VTGFVSAILGALLALLPLMALVVIILVFACAVQRHWPRWPRWARRPRRFWASKVPARNPDGRPLTIPELERFDIIERGYAKTAREPGRRR
jgi:hypothetical protein